jgi:protein-S-isoprenylcysteine O-methyltransferase Ste14
MSDLIWFYVIFFLIAMILPSIRVWRLTGRNPLVLPSGDSVEAFVGLMFKIVILVLGAYLALMAFGVLPRGSGLITDLQSGWTIRFGWFLLWISLIWVVIAQLQMGQSWRVGIDTQVKTELVRSGLFRLSRNPIFLGMMVQLCGMFLIQPDAITLTILVAAFILISVQIRLEETHLILTHGADYERFAKSVGRWI